MQDKSKLELRAKPVQPVQVNKPVVLAIIAVVFLAILLAIIHAFTITASPKASGGSAIKATTDKPIVISPELNALPSSYSDVNSIQKYLSGGSNEEILKLQQQLNALKGAYDSLEEQMRANGKHGLDIQPKNPQDEQAKLSSVVFPGLGTASENLISGAGKGSAENPFGRSPSNQTQDLVATKQQEAFFEREGDNKQRLAVMKAAVDKDKPDEIYDLHSIVKPFSKYQLQAGTIIQATLITGIESTLAGTIVAQTRQDLYDTVTGKHLLIPKGSKLLGEYDSRNVAYGQRRIAMWYTRIVLPNGTSILLGKPAGADLLGQAGVEGNVDNHWARIIGAATISTLLSVGSSMWGNQNANASNYQSNTRQNAAAGASQGFSNIGQDLTGKATGMPPTITLPPGHQFTVTVKKDMVLAPYKSRR